MDNDLDGADESKHLLGEIERTTSGNSSNSVDGGRTESLDTIVFDSKMVKTSTLAGDLAETWGGRRSLPDSGRLRRVHSWSGGPHDDVSSEVRILRERLVRTQTRLDPGAVRLLSGRQRLTLASLAIVDFMSFCSMSVMAPFFPREASAKGLSDAMCGMVFSFYAVVMFLTSPLFGKFEPTCLITTPSHVLVNSSADKTKDLSFLLIGGTTRTKFRRPFLAMFSFTAISQLFNLGEPNVWFIRPERWNVFTDMENFGTLVLIDNTTTFTILCFVIRGLEALGASAYSTASYVFVVNAFPNNIGSVLGILETFVGLGMSVGPAIGGLLYSIGGFGLPFYSLGVLMVLTVPINFFLLTDCEEYVSGSKTASILKLLKIPSIIITGLVIVIVSNTWAFLDPTLEPHLRQFGLSTEQIGLIFLLFSSLYGIFSPIWGWVADRVNNHWCMMVWGLFLSSAGLLLLGPCPFIPGLPRDLWLDLLALSILGMSVALTLLPTFQGVLTSSIYEGGCPEALATYSAVAGVWSCCYSFGEVLGPTLGGVLTQQYGFPLCATLCAAACFTMGVITLTFFSLRESSKWVHISDNNSDSISYTDSTWNSNNFCRTRSAPESRLAENSPLLSSCNCINKNRYVYGTAPQKEFCLLHNKSNKSGSASIKDVIAYFLKFQYITDIYIRIRRARIPRIPEAVVPSDNQHYQIYIENITESTNSNNNKSESIIINNNLEQANNENSYCEYLDEAIFGSPMIIHNVNLDNLKVKRYNKGLVSTVTPYDDQKSLSNEIIRHNIQKVHFYEQNQECETLDDVFDGCECRDGVTFVRGTVSVSLTGACEV